MNFRLSPREKQIAEFLLCGLSYAEMADEMGISSGTVKNLAHDLLISAGMDDQVGLALWLHEHQEELRIECPCKHGYHDGALLVVA